MSGLVSYPEMGMTRDDYDYDSGRKGNFSVLSGMVWCFCNVTASGEVLMADVSDGYSGNQTGGAMRCIRPEVLSGARCAVETISGIGSPAQHK